MAETWQENETHIVLKMINESLKVKDYKKVNELQRSLLNLERRPETSSNSKEEELTSPTPSENSSPRQSLLHESTSDSLIEQAIIKDEGETGKNELADFSPIECVYLEKAMQQNTKQYELNVNIMLVGSQSCGKTTLMYSLLGKKWNGELKSTRGLDSKTTIERISGKVIKYKIIDSDADRSKEFIRKGNLCHYII